jgi:hypothetical protein
MTVEQYERVNEILEISDDEAPDGLLYHVAARSEDGIVIADLWRSREDVERFFDERAGAAIAEAGMPAAEPMIAEVHHHSPGPWFQEFRSRRPFGALVFAVRDDREEVGAAGGAGRGKRGSLRRAGLGSGALGRADGLPPFSHCQPAVAMKRCRSR